jgi:hypothetical protein
MWELNPEGKGSLWLYDLRWGKNHFGWRPPRLEEACRAPFELYPGICLTTDEKHGKPRSGWLSRWRPLDAPTWPSSKGQPRLAYWASAHLGYPSRDFNKPPVGTLPNQGVSRISLLSVETLSVLWYALVAMLRHLDCNTCSFRTWLRTADLQTGHA